MLPAAAAAVLGVAAGLDVGRRLDPRRGGHHGQPGHFSATWIPGGRSTEFTVSLPAQAACSGELPIGRLPGLQLSGGTEASASRRSRSTAVSPTAAATSTGWSRRTAPTGATRTPRRRRVEVIDDPERLRVGARSSGTTVWRFDALLYQDGDTSGVWEAGIACTIGTGPVTDYWNTQVTFTASSSQPQPFQLGRPCPGQQSPRNAARRLMPG